MRQRRHSSIWFTTFLLGVFFLIGLFVAGAVATAQEAGSRETTPQQKAPSNSVLEDPELPQLSGPDSAPNSSQSRTESATPDLNQPSATMPRTEDDVFGGQNLSESFGPLLESPDSIQIIPAPTLEAPEELMPGSWGDFQSLEKPPMATDDYPQKVAPSYTPPTSAPQTPHLGVVGSVVRGWGFRIHQVLPHSAAARMKLEPGDVILNINGHQVDSLETIARALRYSQNGLGGRGLLRIDNVRARGHKCGYRGASSQPARYIWLKFKL